MLTRRTAPPDVSTLGRLVTLLTSQGGKGSTHREQCPGGGRRQWHGPGEAGLVSSARGCWETPDHGLDSRPGVTATPVPHSRLEGLRRGKRWVLGSSSEALTEGAPRTGTQRSTTPGSSPPGAPSPRPPALLRAAGPRGLSREGAGGRERRASPPGTGAPLRISRGQGVPTHKQKTSPSTAARDSPGPALPARTRKPRAGARASGAGTGPAGGGLPVGEAGAGRGD